jgi:hypothetical protein
MLRLDEPEIVGEQPPDANGGAREKRTLDPTEPAHESGQRTSRDAVGDQKVHPLGKRERSGRTGICHDDTGIRIKAGRLTGKRYSGVNGCRRPTKVVSRCGRWSILRRRRLRRDTVHPAERFVLVV